MVHLLIALIMTLRAFRCIKHKMLENESKYLNVKCFCQSVALKLDIPYCYIGKANAVFLLFLKKGYLPESHAKF